ncbi:MAG: M48 family metallopeptidase [Spirochaetaceae bacterium]|jgi:predicted Zn-dependent protease|nr:M48 family metallopeptidase [Spirochaetaceae bacterium]
MKKQWLSVFVFLIFSGCVTNPLTGKSTMALVNNNELLASSFQQYDEFLKESTIISGTAEARLVEQVGARIRGAAEKWLASEGRSEYLNDYRWEYKLILEDTVNAWCMPGGKIVVYTGILPITQTEAGLATVMGHEVAHALLNHGQQRMSAGVLQQLGAVGISIVTAEKNPQTQQLAMTAYGAGSELFGTLPFSRSHESEADHIGLILMAVAGYDPEESIPFWERMSNQSGGSTPEFLSTHPSDSRRIGDLRRWIPEAKEKALSLGGS